MARFFVTEPGRTRFAKLLASVSARMPIEVESFDAMRRRLAPTASEQRFLSETREHLERLKLEALADPKHCQSASPPTGGLRAH